MRSMSIALILSSLLVPGVGMAGPEGTFEVKGTNPDDSTTYAGSVTVTRNAELYRVVWDIANEKTVGVGIGLRLVDGRMVSGPASDKDTGIAISYISEETSGNATYTEGPDGTWQGVWAYDGNEQLATETWVSNVPRMADKPQDAIETKADFDPASKVEPVKLDERRIDDVTSTPRRVVPSPLPANAGPKS